MDLFHPLILVVLAILSSSETATADPRTSVAARFCNTTLSISGTVLALNFVPAMDSLSYIVNKNGFGTTVGVVGNSDNTAGNSDISVFGLGQCYEDLGSVDCTLCFSEIRSRLPLCYPETGGILFLDGCFRRYETYNFFNEVFGPNDTHLCSSVKNSSDPNAFTAAVREVVWNVSSKARRHRGFAIGSASNSSSTVYALAQCWQNLNTALCQTCLDAAASSIVSCLPANEGRALYTGCYLRYSTRLFWNVNQSTPASSGQRSPFSGPIVIGVIVGVSSFILASLTFLLYYCRSKKICNCTILFRSNPEKGRSIESFLEKYGSIAPKRYTYLEVKKITKSFGEKLGKGGFGVVYKGSLSDDYPVAIKVLDATKTDDGEDFFNEIASIGRTSHVNVVSLLGFCYEGSKRALVYDFMPNGSLDRFIYPERSKVTVTPLGWENLFKIAVGIARGLEYLHRGCNTRIVHFDIKPHNILLDQDLCPKISDFGLAKLCKSKESVISMCGARGTAGYIAPEVFSRNFGVVSSKSDVYSYGMMVLEMVGGREKKKTAVAGDGSESEVYFPHWIYRHLDRDGGELRDWCGVTSESEGVARKMILVGLWCIQTRPDDRPSISRVLEMLEGSIGGLEMPPEPFLSSPVRTLISSLSVSLLD